VPGGGTALVKAAATVAERVSEKELAGEELTGYQIVLKALEMPLRQIVLNAGKDDAAVVLEKIRAAKGNAGYDAQNDKIVDDMLKAGIIDPVKVTRSGVQNAVSAAGIMLTTEAAIAEEPEDDKPAMPNPGMGMGGMDY